LITGGRFVPLKKVSKNIPRPVRQIVHRCLAKNPKRRYQSAAQFRLELDLYMAETGMWLDFQERLVSFLHSIDHHSGDSSEVVELSEFSLVSPMEGRSWVRGLLWILIGLFLCGLGAFAFWGLMRLGWLGPGDSPLGASF
jgi:serine/threonine protein kinase